MKKRRTLAEIKAIRRERRLVSVSKLQGATSSGLALKEKRKKKKSYHRESAP